MALVEGAATRVLAAHTDGRARGEQRGERQRFRHAVIHRTLAGGHFSTLLQQLLDLGMNVEAGGSSGQRRTDGGELRARHAGRDVILRFVRAALVPRPVVRELRQAWARRTDSLRLHQPEGSAARVSTGPAARRDRSSLSPAAKPGSTPIDRRPRRGRVPRTSSSSVGASTPRPTRSEPTSATAWSSEIAFGIFLPPDERAPLASVCFPAATGARS